MSNTHILCALGLAMLAPSLTLNAKDASSEPIRLALEWNLSLDAQGAITRLEAVPNKRADRVPAIRERLEKAIHSWRFQPGAINGQARPTDTHLTVAISVVPQDADTALLRIDSARTGAHVDKAVPPRYPPSAAHDHRTGMVVLRVKYDADGSVASAEPDPDAPKVDSTLKSAATKAVEQWKFKTEVVGGMGVAGTAVVPFCFNLFPASAVSKSMPIPECHWKPKGQTAQLGEGEALALEPVARLTTEVAGHTL